MKFLTLGLILFGLSFSGAVVLAIYSLVNHDYNIGFKITPIFLPIILGSIMLCAFDKQPNSREVKE